MPTRIEIDNIDFGPMALLARPAHAAVLGRIITSWSLIDGCVTGLLGLMMHNNHRAAFAILESFKNNKSRVDAVRRIGKEVLDPSLFSNFDALMKDVLSYATERNAMAHGLWGSREDKPEIVYRAPMKALPMVVIGSPNTFAGDDVEALLQPFYDGLKYFSVNDLEKIEETGRDLLSRIVKETTNKAYSRASENQKEDPSRYV